MEHDIKKFLTNKNLQINVRKTLFKKLKSAHIFDKNNIDPKIIKNN